MKAWHYYLFHYRHDHWHRGKTSCWLCVERSSSGKEFASREVRLTRLRNARRPQTEPIVRRQKDIREPTVPRSMDRIIIVRVLLMMLHIQNEDQVLGIAKTAPVPLLGYTKPRMQICASRTCSICRHCIYVEHISCLFRLDRNDDGESARQSVNLLHASPTWYSLHCKSLVCQTLDEVESSLKARNDAAGRINDRSSIIRIGS